MAPPHRQPRELGSGSYRHETAAGDHDLPSLHPYSRYQTRRAGQSGTVKPRGQPNFVTQSFCIWAPVKPEQALLRRSLCPVTALLPLPQGSHRRVDVTAPAHVAPTAVAARHGQERPGIGALRPPELLVGCSTSTVCARSWPRACAPATTSPRAMRSHRTAWAGAHTAPLAELLAAER